MKLITAIAALALVVGSFILVQPAWAKIQNVDEDSWCMEAGYNSLPIQEYANLTLRDCDSEVVNVEESFEQNGYEGVIVGNREYDLGDPPFQWVYDPDIQWIRTKTKPIIRNYKVFSRNMFGSFMMVFKEVDTGALVLTLVIPRASPRTPKDGIRCPFGATKVGKQDSKPIGAIPTPPNGRYLTSGYMIRTPNS